MRYASILLTLALISASQLNDCDAAEPARETTYLFVDDSVPYGFEEITKRSLPNGNLEIASRSELKLELLGTRSDVRVAHTHVVSAQLQPISLQVSQSGSAGDVQVTGRVEGDTFVLRRESQGMVRMASVDLRNGVVFRGLLPDVLLRRQTKSEDKVIEISVIDEDALTIRTMRCELIPCDTSETVIWSYEALGMDAVDKGRLIFKRGELERIVSDLPVCTLQRGTPDEAAKIVRRKLDGRHLLMFEVDKAIPRVDFLQEMTIKLCWKTTPFDQLRLADGRQAVVSHTFTDGQHQAIVRISTVDPLMPPTESLSNEDRTSYLAKSRYLDPTDEEIRKQAREWTKDCKSTTEIVSVLTTRVFDHLIGGELVMETLSGPEVLKCRKGKCSEYSTLFASLSRSLNIPTRIVLGDRLAGGYWVGHMWNEVFMEDPTQDRQGDGLVGRWVTVDATVKEVGNSMSLLKLTHSATVDGTQPVRWGLTDSLEVAVTNFVLQSRPSSDEWNTGLERNQYTNAEYGIRISAPADGWKIVPEVKAGNVIVRFHSPRGDQVLIHGVGLSLPVAFDAKTLLGFRNARFQATYRDYKVLSTDAETINERVWSTLKFKRAIGEKETKDYPGASTMQTTEYLFVQGTVGVLVNLICEESVHHTNVDDLKKIVESVQFKAANASQKSGQ